MELSAMRQSKFIGSVSHTTFNRPARSALDLVDDMAAVNIAEPLSVKTELAIPPGQKSSFKDLFSFTRRSHVPIIGCAFATAALVAVARTAYAIVLGRIFECVSEWGAGGLDNGDFQSQISRWSVYMTLLGLAIWLFSGLDIAVWVVTGELRARTARNIIFSSLLRKTAEWYDSRADGMSSLMIGIQTQTRELQMATSQTLGFLVCDVFVFTACLIVAFYYSYRLTLVMLATGVPSALILWLVSRFLDPAIEAQKRELAQATKHAAAATTAIDLVKVYNGADHEAFRFMAAIRRSARYYARQVLCNCAQMAYVKLWMIMLFVVGFYFAVVLVSWHQITPGDALTTFYAALIAFQSIEALGPQWLVLAKGMAAGMLLETLVSELQGGQQVDKITGLRRPATCFGDVQMENVSFAYPTNPTKTVLAPSNFRFPASQITFVVGRSGSGKSTLANLLLRFYEPLTGRITVDGHSVTELDLDWLRRNITLIQQSSVLFNDTFFRNVAFGAPEPDRVTVDEVRAACNMALLQSTIAGLPEGLDTQIGPGGYSLSGGQRQRLALARAKLRDSPVLILDELTSGLDPVSRSLIMEAIRVWRKGKTTVIITHEVGHIDGDEYVYVVEDGNLVQEGLGKALSADPDGLFASLLASADDDGEPRPESELLDEGEDDDTDVESHVSGDEEGEPAPEPRYDKFLHALSLDRKQPPSGLFHRLSWQAETDGYQSDDSRRSSKAESMNLVAEMGRETQNRRRKSNIRQARLEKSAAPGGTAGLDSLDRFFLERVARPKKGEEREERTATPHRLPSLASILRTVWPTLDARGKGELLLGLMLCLVMAACNPLFSYIFAHLLAAFWLPDGQQAAEGSRWARFLAIVAVADAAATFFGYFFMERAAQIWVDTLRAEAIKRILAQPKAWFDEGGHSPSHVTHCLERNAEEMRKLVGMFVPILLTVMCMISTSLVWALVIRWDLTLVTLAGLPVAIGAARANSVASDKWEALCDGAAALTDAVFSETFANIKVVRALTLEAWWARKHAASVAATYRVGVRRAAYVGVFYGFYQSLTFFLTALVFFYGAKILAAGLTTATDVLRIVNLLLFSLGTSVAMLANLPQIAAAKVTAVQVLYYANLDHAVSHEARGALRLTAAQGWPLPVRMANLRFAYPGAPATLVLRNVNLAIRPGTCTAIVGASGCGKSTIAALLLRLYEPLPPEDEAAGSNATEQLPSVVISPPSPVARRGGEQPPSSQRRPPPPPPPGAATLTFADCPASALHTASLRGAIGYVPQHPFLFPGTVRENILYGLPDDFFSSASAQAQAQADAETSRGILFSSSSSSAAGAGGGGAVGSTSILGWKCGSRRGLHPSSSSGNDINNNNNSSEDNDAQGYAAAAHAARQAGIHDFIASLPAGYDTAVGEGGQAVSGGQAQRLSIARALARRPRLLVLDEPTSALDAAAAEGVRRVVRDLVSESVRGGDGSGMAVVVITHSKEMMRVADTIAMVDQGTVVETACWRRRVDWRWQWCQWKRVRKAAAAAAPAQGEDSERAQESAEGRKCEYQQEQKQEQEQGRGRGV
ncbi:P-loop containing nucleoside triphosphate hydrolase protein [Lasiosphaeria miniovina]|uniref:P-loop containing nucleoside triphosphate hydrolase protein n=1 Tax=Lasiosphaeria miniovina TaxID=1954250 RepID=A0AA40ABH1_9PEZI|nr:P-loop containing nucleoside triphosphate hydrolase protein [Lasiosphaeria miniovina]KAK0712842.1 P-loop containing nucleoside triphosphate hydrolase protein [Lasiosphaeria miniovina]